MFLSFKNRPIYNNRFSQKERGIKTQWQIVSILSGIFGNYRAEMSVVVGMGFVAMVGG